MLVVFVVNLLSVTAWQIDNYSPYGPHMCLTRCQIDQGPCFYTVSTLRCIHAHLPVTKIHQSEKRDLTNCSKFIEEADLSTTTEPGMCLIEPDAPRWDSNTTASLHEACASGDICSVQYLVSLGMADIDGWFKGITPVMATVRTNRPTVFSFLAKHGCDLSAVTNRSSNLLHLAALSGGLGIAHQLIDDYGFSIESKGWKLATPVMRAAQGGHVKMFQWLMCRGANGSAVGDTGYNVLLASATSGHVNMVEEIVERKLVDLDSKSINMGNTAAMVAAARGHLEVLQYLLAQGSDMWLVSKDNFNMLHMAAIFGSTNTLSYLIDRGFDPDCRKSDTKDTALLLTAKNGHVEAFELLRRRGSDLSVVDFRGLNILHWACWRKQLHMVKHILEHDLVDINSIVKKTGRTPIQFAARICSIDIMEVLRRKHCNMSLTTRKGYNILHAVTGCSAKVVEYVMSLGAVHPEARTHSGYTPVLFAAARGNVETFRYLSSQNCSLNVTGKHGYTILHFASLAGHLRMAEYIITQGLVDVKAEALSDNRETPILAAIKSCNRTIFDFLIRNGAQCSEMDIRHRTTLHLSCKYCGPKMCTHILQKCRSFIYSRDITGATPAMWAAKYGKTEVLKLLINNGSHVSDKDAKGRDILHYACRVGKIDTVAYIYTKNGLTGSCRNVWLCCKKAIPRRLPKND